MSNQTVGVFFGGSQQIVVGDGNPCPHKGCSHHATHPCEGCGRTMTRGESVLTIRGGEIVSREVRVSPSSNPLAPLLENGILERISKPVAPQCQQDEIMTRIVGRVLRKAANNDDIDALCGDCYSAYL